MFNLRSKNLVPKNYFNQKISTCTKMFLEKFFFHNNVKYYLNIIVYNFHHKSHPHMVLINIPLCFACNTPFAIMNEVTVFFSGYGILARPAIGHRVILGWLNNHWSTRPIFFPTKHFDSLQVQNSMPITHSSPKCRMDLMRNLIGTSGQ